MCFSHSQKQSDDDELHEERKKKKSDRFMTSGVSHWKVMSHVLIVFVDQHSLTAREARTSHASTLKDYESDLFGIQVSSFIVPSA